MGRPDLVVAQAAKRDRSADPLLRQEMTQLLAFQKASEWTAGRAKAAQALGRPPGSEGSIGKLALSEVARQSNHVHTRIAGADGMLTGFVEPTDAAVAEVLISTPAQSIAGGTDEIQHNIIGENMLGLPREPAADRGVPFKDVGRNTTIADPNKGTNT